jgi:S-adenosylmethionine:tRNA ribosyltransferase-isomerase
MTDLNINDFNYELPKESIAKFPLEKRSTSKLLIFKDNEIIHKNFSDIPNYLNENFFLVRNSTKVIYARLKAQKETGGKAEILCVEPISPSNDPQISLMAKNENTWKCIIGGSRINKGSKLLIPELSNINLSAVVIEKENNTGIVKFTWLSDLTFAELLQRAGEIPLPPYLDRNAEENDKNTYQTVYAKSEGSVAAPTAGLHFDDEIISKLELGNVKILDLVLHVGPGTFLPIAEEIKNHKMHEEMIFINSEFIDCLISELNLGKKLTAVGTTTLRTLESLYWYGVKLSENSNAEFSINQYEAFERKNNLSFLDSLKNIQSKHKNDNVIIGKTSIFILPGYPINTAEVLITNFHQPKSTLLLLISSFIGNEQRKQIYASALENNYRFLSYGDSSILFR